jgi:YHS domain-containing protein
MTTLETAVKDLPTKTIDPVCGMDVEPGRTKLVSVYKGHSYWFCANGCREAFEANPTKYLEPKPAKKKGWFGRFLERMAKTNEKEFGPAGPRCCH